MFFPASKKHPLSTLSSSYRLDLLEMIYRSGSGHFGGPLSSIDILISLYKSQIFNPPRDHFVLSAGHLAPALYVVLANSGFFDKKLLNKFATLKLIPLFVSPPTVSTMKVRFGKLSLLLTNITLAISSTLLIKMVFKSMVLPPKLCPWKL